MSSDLDKRSQEIFGHIVEAYVETGEPVGSRTLSKRLGLSLSPATIRNVMADLEESGLLFSPHTSAGRLPTEAGMRFFVHALMEVTTLSDVEQSSLRERTGSKDKSLPSILEDMTSVLSGLSHCAGLVLAPKHETSLKHVEFVFLNPGRALAVLVTEDGIVENRVIEVPLGILPSSLTQASNFLNARLAGKTLSEAKGILAQELHDQQDQMDNLAKQVVEDGLGLWASGKAGGTMIVRGQSRLLNNVREVQEIDQLKTLFDTLERKESLLTLVDAALAADGVQIFIGSENNLFNHTGCSVILSPYENSSGRVVGAIGVIGPTRMNYGRIVPMVNYTADLITKMMSKGE